MRKRIFSTFCFTTAFLCAGCATKQQAPASPLQPASSPQIARSWTIATKIGNMACTPLAVNNNSRVLLECNEPDGPTRFAIWEKSGATRLAVLAPKYQQLDVFRATGFSDDDTIVGQLEKPFPPPGNAWYSVGFISGERTLPPNFVPTDISSDGSVISGYRIDRNGSSASPSIVHLVKNNALEAAPGNPKFTNALLSERVNNAGAVLGQTYLESKVPQAEQLGFTTVGGHFRLLFPSNNSPLTGVRTLIFQSTLHGNGFQINNPGDIVIPYQVGHFDPTDEGGYVADRIGSLLIHPDGSRMEVGPKDSSFGSVVTGLNDQGVMIGTEFHADGDSADFVARPDGTINSLPDLFPGDPVMAASRIAGINNINEIIVVWRSATEPDDLHARLLELPR